MVKLTLPTDSAARKKIPLLSGVLKYAPAALAGVARISYEGNEKHNPGEPLHHARGKSMDHGDCIIRHTMDLEDLRAQIERDPRVMRADSPLVQKLLEEAFCRAWRALIEAQELAERYAGAPLAPGARLPETLQVEHLQCAGPAEAQVERQQPVEPLHVLKQKAAEADEEAHKRSAARQDEEFRRRVRHANGLL